MSNAEATPLSPEPNAPKKSYKVLWMILAPILFILGIMQMYRGVNQMFGSSLDPQVKKLLDESDQAIAEANKLTQGVQPDFLGLLGDVDKLGLDAVRKQKHDAAQTVSDQFGKAAAQFRLAQTKIDQALQLKSDDKVKAFLQGKSKAYGLFAQVCDDNQKIVGLVLDNSIAKLDDLLPKLNALAEQRDALQKQAQDTDASADQVAGVAKSPPKP